MDNSLLEDFDESGLDTSRTVVRCITQDEANIFLDYLCCKRIWNKGNARILKDRWKEYGSSTCYHISRDSWCHDSWYELNGFDVVDFCEIYKKHKPVSVPFEICYEDLFT